MKKHCIRVIALLQAAMIGILFLPIDSMNICGKSGLCSVYAAEEEKTPSGIPIDELEDVLDGMTADIVGKSVAGMAVLVAKNGKVVFEKGYGYSDIENKVAVNSRRTVFEWGSITKTMVWVAAMKLYEEGKLDLNQDIKTYLPKDFVSQMNAKKKITMLNLMNHTAGFDEYVVGVFNDKNKMLDLEKSLWEEEAKQYYEPGSVCTYSNYGAGLAGYVVECIAGMDLYEYVQKNIYEPAGMNSTSMHPLLLDNKLALYNRSNAYSYKNDKLVKETHTYISMYPAGGANGTAYDLLKFGMNLSDKEDNVLFKNKITREKLFQTTYKSDAEIAGISHGFFQYEGAYPTYWHNGGTNYFNTFLAIVPDQDFVVAVLANTDVAEDIVHQVGWGLVCKSEEQAKKQVNTECEAALIKELPDVENFIGDYQSARICHEGMSKILFLLPEYDYLVRKADKNSLYMNDELYIQVTPGVFINSVDGTHVAFHKMKDGKMKLTYIQDNFRVTKLDKLLSYLIISVIAALLLSMMIVMSYRAVCYWKRKKAKLYICSVEKKSYGLVYTNIIVFLGYVINLFVYLVEFDSGYYFSQVRYHAFINMGMGAAIMVLSILSIKNMMSKEVEDRGCKISIITYSICSIFYVVILGICGMYESSL